MPLRNASAGDRAGALPVWGAALLLVGTAAWAAYREQAEARRAAAESEARAAVERMPLGSGQVTSVPHLRFSDWKAVLFATYGRIVQHRLLAVAAGVVFYGLLALFPAITAFVSFYGMFADASTINEHLALASGVMPDSAFQIVTGQVARSAAHGGAKLSLGFIFGLGLAVWSANAGMKAIMDALNAVDGEAEKRGLIKLNLVSLTLTLGAIAVLLFGLSAGVAFPLLLRRLGLEAWSGSLLSTLRWPVLFLLMMIGVEIVYRFGPSRTAPHWRWLSVGAVFATVAWLAGSALFSIYLSNFANYDATYGSLGAAIVLMTWMWLSTIAILVGAVLDSEVGGCAARAVRARQARAAAVAPARLGYVGRAMKVMRAGLWPRFIGARRAEKPASLSTATISDSS